MVSCIVWRTIGWSGISTGPATFSWQAAACGNSAAIMSSDSMRWIGGGLRRPPLKRSTTSDRLRFHRQRLWNIGDGGDGPPARAPPRTVLECRKRGTSAEREAVVRPERQHDGVVVGRRLQLEVERHAEPLAQRQAERPVDPTAVGRVHHQVHALRVVEEPLEHEVGVGGDDAQHRAAGGQVVDDLIDRGVVERGGRRQPGPGAVGVADGEVAVERGPQLGDLVRQLGRARRGLAGPERDGGRLAVGVDHPHDAGAHLADLPRVGAEQEDVAGHRLDRPVLVDGADEHVVGLEHHPEVADLGDGAARGQRRQPGRRAGRGPRR